LKSAPDLGGAKDKGEREEGGNLYRDFGGKKGRGGGVAGTVFCHCFSPLERREKRERINENKTRGI